MRRFVKGWWAPVLFCAYVPLYAQNPPQTPPPAAPAPVVPQTAAPAVQQQTPAPAPAPTAAPAPAPAPTKKRWTVGLRGRDFPMHSLSVMDSRTVLTTTTKAGEPVRDWNFTTTSHSPVWGAGIAVEYAANDRWSFTAEVLYDQLKYTKVTSIAWGTTDPTVTTDQRTHMFRSESTKAILLDGPVMVHRIGLAESGPLSHLYIGAGATVRAVTSIKTSTQITFPDTSTSTNTIVASPSKRNLIGAVFGLGVRFVDDFNIAWKPEIRYTRWAGSTFATDSTLSPRNQIEVGLAFTF